MVNIHEKVIFVIDDDDDVREVMTWALSQQGYIVKGFRNPIKALKRLNIETPALILVDYHMDQMGGLEFLNLKNLIMNESVKNCPVVIVTGSPHDVEENIESHVYHSLIAKPLDMDSLVKTVSSIFGKRDFPQEAPVLSLSER